jgi:hypothetical protein
MVSRALRLIAIPIAAITSLVSAQQASIHDEVQQVYNFQPHLLNQQQIQERSGALDQFWKKVKDQPARYLPALRQELGSFTNPPFFLYDGSMLLLSLSDTPADRKIALAAIAHCDLLDLQAAEYFAQVHRLAALNEDTTAAALHILEQPSFTVFIPQHVLTLGQDYALVYLLLPTDQSFWLSPAIARLGAERDQTAQKSLLLLLWYAQTDIADKAIRDFAGDSSRSAEARSYAQGLMGRKGNLGVLQRAEALVATEGSLRQKRREGLKVVSDEALLDLDSYTMLLIAKRQ